MAATVAAIAKVGPAGVKGRSIAREADVYHAQIQQMFGSVDELVALAVLEERDRFVHEVFDESGGLPDPLSVADYPDFWRAITQVLLDPGPVELSTLADGGPVDLLRRRLSATGPGRDPAFETAIAATWAAAPLGALIFAGPLRSGLGITDKDWGSCWARLGERIQLLGDLPGLPSTPTPSESAPLEPDAHPGERGREQLLLAAESLLEKRLETAITGRELAAAAGVNYGLVSHYFGSKTAVFDEALADLHERFLRDILEVTDPTTQGSFHVFSRHRAFLRAWASRLLAGRPTPDFPLLGMERLMEGLTTAREIRPRDSQARLDAAGDALSSVALQLGWTILRPLPTAADLRGIDEIVANLQAINTWLVRGRVC